ncbi:sigma-70 family RNA polymerase sigma factor [Roseomonas sp. AR75]|uniref:sigma-70 family RNA polymerase sigma factor n=1 Tax=Roseomonas sp. AR75 TaxID=2562311 RepID=UPI001485622C|nr:sigma-70 family RNA polymerase sigma factor [Roseomonas sp. AR75]
MALAAARYHAQRFARRSGLTAPDRDDLAQDILLAIVEAQQRFDPSRGAWSTFVATLARRVLIDRCRRPRAPDFVSLDTPCVAALVAKLPAQCPDIDVAIVLAMAVRDLPKAPQSLLGDILAHSDVSAARDSRSTSPATFYRELHDLRLWLRALGVRPSASSATAARR